MQRAKPAVFRGGFLAHSPGVRGLASPSSDKADLQNICVKEETMTPGDPEETGTGRAFPTTFLRLI